MNEESFFVGLMIGIILTGFTICNNFSIWDTEIEHNTRVCIVSNSKLKRIYVDGDFECSNKSFFLRGTKIND